MLVRLGSLKTIYTQTRAQMIGQPETPAPRPYGLLASRALLKIFSGCLCLQK
ncbi:MAG: hypothetical protein ACFNLD_09920 [Kingella oralis]